MLLKHYFLYRIINLKFLRTFLKLRVAINGWISLLGIF